MLLVLPLVLVANVSAQVESHYQSKTTPKITVREYGQLSTGEQVDQYTLTAHGITLKTINYGGIITHLEVPDKNGIYADVVLGYDTLTDYEHKNRYFGALVGRYANRIAQGKAKIGQQLFQLEQNRPPHQLHGGSKGFDKVYWQAETEVSQTAAKIHYTYTSPDGAAGYPGQLKVKVSYIVRAGGKLEIQYRANTNKVTIFNPTQHSYFNLSGQDNKQVLDHELTIYSQEIVELDNQSIPTGNFIPVNTTAFDFSQPTKIASNLAKTHPQLTIGKGYDHYYVVQKSRGELTNIAQLFEANSGRKLTISSTESGAQIYSANYLNETVIGKRGVAYQKYQGICIETGQLPNAPAMSTFPTYLLKPNQEYLSTTIFDFTIKR